MCGHMVALLPQLSPKWEFLATEFGQLFNHCAQPLAAHTITCHPRSWLNQLSQVQHSVWLYFRTGRHEPCQAELLLPVISCAPNAKADSWDRPEARAGFPQKPLPQKP